MHCFNTIDLHLKTSQMYKRQFRCKNCNTKHILQHNNEERKYSNHRTWQDLCLDPNFSWGIKSFGWMKRLTNINILKARLHYKLVLNPSRLEPVPHIHTETSLTIENATLRRLKPTLLVGSLEPIPDESCFCMDMQNQR